MKVVIKRRSLMGTAMTLNDIKCLLCILHFLWTNTTNLHSSCGKSSFSDLAWFYPCNERTLSRTHQLNSTVRLNLNRGLSPFMIARWYNLTSRGYTFFHHFLIWFWDLYRSWIDVSPHDSLVSIFGCQARPAAGSGRNPHLLLAWETSLSVLRVLTSKKTRPNQ